MRESILDHCNVNAITPARVYVRVDAYVGLVYTRVYGLRVTL